MELAERQKRDRERMLAEIGDNLKQYAIRGTDEDWAQALGSVDSKAAKKIGILSVKNKRLLASLMISLDRLRQWTFPKSRIRMQSVRKREGRSRIVHRPQICCVDVIEIY